MDAPQQARGVPLHPEVLAEFPDHWPAGIAPARDGRIFLSFPRVDPVPSPVNLGELIDGRVVPYPDELVNAIDPTDTQHRFLNVHGIAIGPGQRLYALDTGARSFDGCDPELAKLYVIDLDRNAIVHGIGFPRDVCLPSTYLNDIRVDYSRGKAGYGFITDSGSQGPNGIIVVDLDSGKSWRRLSGTAAVQKSDGIALSPDGATLWWTPLQDHGLFSIETELLCDLAVDDRTLERHVRSYDARSFGSDGLFCDREGRLYLTDVAHGTVRRFIPGENRYETLLGGEGLMEWPDSLALGPDRILYVTDSQLNLSPRFNGGVDGRRPPYRLYRAAIDADPAGF